MIAVVNEKYGSPDILELQELEIPTPGDREVLIKIMAASVNAYDWHLLRADPFLVRIAGLGFFKPKNKILGADIAGRIEAVGRGVEQFKPGDEIFGDLSGDGNGGFAEYVCANENSIVLKPAGITFEEAAAMPMAAITALQALRDDGCIKSGQKVLINGASGGVGTFAVQIAKSLGAEVTAVCSSTKVELVQSLGADHVIDYNKEDFTKNGQSYDLILAANGYHHILDYKRALTGEGIYVMTGGAEKQMYQALLLGPLLSLLGKRTLGSSMAKLNKEDLIYLGELTISGKMKSVIDRCYPLRETANAIRYVEEGHARGKVIITTE
ncbi:MAG: NAD(P)-dependent alcohol dehydrogenase [Spirochaetaceae bacterium]|nr:NAD(P)-dependent alcohol dehydrogenase [Spirochaetaceae bacterium]